VRCYRAESDGIVLAVRLTPKGGRDAIDGIADLGDRRAVAAVRVRAAADKGAANAALLALLARTFGRAKRDVILVAGTASRLKQVRIAGDPQALAAVVESWPSRSAG
jgi:uncharacterized protein (TIGR00251 family)